MEDIFKEIDQQPFFPRPSQQTVYWDATGLFVATSILATAFLCVSVGSIWIRVFCDEHDQSELDEFCDDELYDS